MEIRMPATDRRSKPEDLARAVGVRDRVSGIGFPEILVFRLRSKVPVPVSHPGRWQGAPTTNTVSIRRRSNAASGLKGQRNR
jgi:hypothetical protein